MLTTKTSYFLIKELSDSGLPALGECSLIAGLSPDPLHNYEAKLTEVCLWLNKERAHRPELDDYPSIRYGLEMLEDDVRVNGSKVFIDSDFTQGKGGMLINGLIWMGAPDFMLEQVQQKLDQGFNCLKFKVGALDFEEEIKMLERIRSTFGNALEIRLDANGGFLHSDALEKLERLSSLNIHSIEQPIQPKHWEKMARLCQRSPIPIALDEELIGARTNAHLEEMLDTIRPQYIILKPSLLGGIKRSAECIRLANERNIGWWMTSALESNVGLNHIAQCTYQLGVSMPQGLGTGGLYTNNFDSPLYIQGEMIKFDPKQNWNLKHLTDE